MKRFFHLIMLFIAALAITSCEPVNEDRTVYVNPTDASSPNAKQYIFDEQHNGNNEYYDVHHFIYRGHSYIVLEQGSGDCLGIAAVHDPDCQCNRHQRDQLNAIICKQDSISQRLIKIEKGLNSQYKSSTAFSKELTDLRRGLNKVSLKLDSIR